MANKILIIGVGSAGSIVADKIMKDYPELFNSIAIDGHPIGGEVTSCPYIDLMEGRPNECPGFLGSHIQEQIEGKIDEIRECIKNAFED